MGGDARDDPARAPSPAWSPRPVSSICGRPPTTRLGDGATEAFLGGEPADVPDRYDDASPIEHLPLGVPVLCVHGRADDVVPLSQSESFVAAAARRRRRRRAGRRRRRPLRRHRPGQRAWAAVLAWLDAADRTARRKMAPMPTDWNPVLRGEFAKPYWPELQAFVAAERQRHTVYPPPDEVFAALHLTPYAETKVLILGQDPYHGPRQAHGLCFSVRRGVRHPAVARQHPQGAAGRPRHRRRPTTATSRRGRVQGVLLLNTTLTVRAGQAASHQGQGWETFTDEVIRTVARQGRPRRVHPVGQPRPQEAGADRRQPAHDHRVGPPVAAVGAQRLLRLQAVLPRQRRARRRRPGPDRLAAVTDWSAQRDGYDPLMARPVWSGTISFGLVSVPVKAHTAVRDHDVHFNQLEKRTGSRIRNRKVSEKSGKEVDADDIEMGFEISKGHYVTFDKEELVELRPASTRAVEVTDFVPLEQVDPIYFERTYWLAPDGDQANKAYQLLLAAMEDRGLVAIGTVVMRNKEYLTAIRPLDGALAMSTMRFADEVVPRKDIEEVPSRRSKPEPKALQMATQLIDAMTTDWKPERYHDTYEEELRGADRGQGQGRGDRRSGAGGARRRDRRSDGGVGGQRRIGQERAQAAPGAADGLTFAR